MKPQYVFLLMLALFITGLADGLEAAVAGLGGLPATIPLIGTFIAAGTEPAFILMGMTISFCINITMGAGLLLLLISNGMYHPKFGPFALVGGILPGFDVLPFWLGLVIAGIVFDMQKEGGALGALAGVAGAVLSKNPSSVAGALSTATQAAHALQPAQPPASAANENAPERPRVASTLIHDIKPPSAANNNLLHPHAQAA